LHPAGLQTRQHAPSEMFFDGLPVFIGHIFCVPSGKTDMETSFNLTLYVDDKPIALAVNVVSDDNTTRYKVAQTGTSKIEILPQKFVIASDGTLVNSEGKETVEQLQLIRLIWQNISNMVSV
jgi:hypothetical protein